jgi:hypothetical protein
LLKHDDGTRARGTLRAATRRVAARGAVLPRAVLAPALRPRVLIVAEHASARFGGEPVLPLHYFRVLRARGIPAWMIVHERTREELRELFPADLERIRFVPDSALHRVLWGIGRRLPARLRMVTCGVALRALTQLAARRLARRLVREEAIDVVHQPIPVSPREPSFLHGLGAPVVIGPMNGGMEYPEAFRSFEGRATRTAVGIARLASGLANRIAPGKRRAHALIVANERTRRALPGGVRGRVVELSENGVDLSLWSRGAPAEAPVRTFVFLGRLVDLKASTCCSKPSRGSRGACRCASRSSAKARCAAPGRSSPRASASPSASRSWAGSRRARRRSGCARPTVSSCRASTSAAEPWCSRRWRAASRSWRRPGAGPPNTWPGTAASSWSPRPAKRSSRASRPRSSAWRPLARSAGVWGRTGGGRAVEAYDWERKVDRMLEIYSEAVAAQR